MKRTLVVLTLVLVIALSFTKTHLSQSGQIITTVAGSNGDGVPAVNSTIAQPRAAAFDAAGNLYIVDYLHNRIRKVNKNTGIITTVAGNGVFGFSGDGGLAVNAALKEPFGVAVDAAGNIYIGDTGNSRVRKVDASTGIISTIGGTGCQTCPLGDGGPASNASFPGPKGLALDSAGNIYVADTGTESRIRKINKLTGIVTTVAGGSGAGSSNNGDGGPAANSFLDTVYGLAIDRNDNIFIPETFSNRVRKVDAATGIITTFAGNGIGGNAFSGDGGPATNAALTSPFAAATDSLGNLYIADTLNQRIRKVDSSGTITTVAGNGGLGSDGIGGPAVNASLGTPQGIAVDGDDNFYIVNTETNFINKVDASTGIITVYAGNGMLYFSGDGGPATSATFGKTSGVAADIAGNLYISDNFDNRVRRVDAATGVITTLGNYGGPAGLAFDGSGNLYIAETNGFRILKVNVNTGAAVVVAGGGDYCSYFSCDPGDFITAAGQNNLGIAENTIPTSSLTISTGFLGDGGPATSALLLAPSDVAVGSDGNIYIAEAGSINRIRMVDVAGKFGTAGNIYTVATGFRQPQGIALDNDDNIYIADSFSGRIRKIDAATGAISTVGPSLNRPMDLTVDNFGNLYIADAVFQGIRRVDAVTGIITTVAGNGTKGFSGDGGPATSASLNAPSSLALHFGKLYIADTENKRVRSFDVDSGCNFILNPTRKDAAASASSGNAIAVYASSAGCNWTASANASWLHITGGASGTGNGTVTYSIDSNSGPARTGTLTVAGITFTVHQANGCSFLLGASVANVAKTASEGNTVAVNASNANCSWEAVSNDDWIHITSGDSGSGNGTVTYSVDANTDSARSGTLTIAGITFTVNQASGQSGAPATPVISWNNPADIVFGTALSGVQLNASADVPGTFSYNPPTGTVLNAGNGQTLSVVFTPTDAVSYTTASKSVLINVQKATPTITWSNPANIAYGTPLSNTQLNASADVSGSFVYNPPAGTLLNAGNGQTLSVTFTPNDSANYNNASKNVSINVLKQNTAVQLSSSANPSVAGQQLTFTATLAPTGTPTGTVNFFDGAAAIGSGMIIGGQASFNISTLTAGDHTITAVYSGDSNFNGSSSGALTQTIGNTGTGTNVPITPVDSTTGQPGPVTITFGNVTSGGTTTLLTSPNGQPLPNGFKLGNPPVYYELSTTATFTGTATVCIRYPEGSFGNESNAKLLHGEGSVWVDRTSSLDTTNNIICASVTSFSPFIIVEPGATINIEAAFHSTGNGGSTKTPLALELKVFNKSAVGSPDPKDYGTVWNTAAAISSAVISAPTVVSVGGGQANSYVIQAPAANPAIPNSGSYLVIGKASITSGGTTTVVYVGAPTDPLAAGSSTKKYLQVVQSGNGKIIPAKTTEVVGSLLLIIEPEYLEFVPSQDVLPIIYESIDGDWSSTVEFTAPDGFDVSPKKLDASVTTNQEQVLQFTVISTAPSAPRLSGAIAPNNNGNENGNEKKVAKLKHKLKHNGKDKTIDSEIEIVEKKK